MTKFTKEEKKLAAKTAKFYAGLAMVIGTLILIFGLIPALIAIALILGVYLVTDAILG